MSAKLLDSSRLYHMLDAAQRIEQRTKHSTLADFLHNEDLQDIIVRQFTIMGEAASRLSSAITATSPQVDWRQIVNFRNFLVHEYFRVDLNTVWYTAVDLIPNLAVQLAHVLQETLTRESGTSDNV